MRIEWNDNYAIGHAEIDVQHQEWFSKVSDFIESIGTAQFKEFELAMNDYTARHFEHEEQLMRSVNYPEYANHVQQHVRLVKLIGDLAKNFEAGHLDREVWRHYLTEWLLGHIRNTDQKLAHYVAQGTVNAAGSAQCPRPA
jgi:hemerythrin-like metal-binding protein